VSDTPDNPPPSEPPDEPAPQRQSTSFLVLQFFIFPMAIVAVCVAVFVVFGLIAAEGKSARQYLEEVRSGGANRRWQAAFELSKVLQSGKHKSLRESEFVAELVRLFEDATADDPRVRRYLALAMGRLGDPRAVPVLSRVLRESGADADSETMIYAAWALGAIGDRSAVPVLADTSTAEDAGLRKAAVHALGALPGDESRAALERSLADAADDVRWNAALALARRGDAAAAPVLVQMLDREALAKTPGLTPEQRETVLLEAAAAAGAVPHDDLKAALLALRDRDPNLRVREAARAALAGRRPTPAASPAS
jgi:HEAT repeat protein